MTNKNNQPSAPPATFVPLCPQCDAPIDAGVQMQITPQQDGAALVSTVACRNCHRLLPIVVTLLVPPQPINPTQKHPKLII